MTENAYLNKEIISIFDYTNNTGAKEFLRGLFERKGVSYDDIISRQALLSTFVQHWGILEGFSYQRYDFEEVYNFTTTLKSSYEEESVDWVNLIFNRDRHRIKSRCSQAVLFLDKLYVSYFQRISSIAFPLSFQLYPDSIISFIKVLEIEPLADSVKKGTGLSLTDIPGFLKRLLKAGKSGELAAFWQSLFVFEAFWSVAKGIKVRNFVFPVITADRLLLEKFYHPMIKNPVANDFSNCNNVMLLTGPNMAGKSTVLKSISICVLLAHLGFAVPANRCEVPFYDDFLISINVTDDIQNGYSHFMQEIVNLKEILQKAVNGKKCFAVFDEMFCGTNIDDAIDITCSTVKGMVHLKGSFFIISTHLYQLNNLLPEGSFEAWQLEAMVDDGMPRHTYVLKKGWSQLKFGKLLFEKEGLNKLLKAGEQEII
ncbi:MutS-related protein [Chitinophaga flava]|uniref:DNA mismatch repair proteins mutS family domain-containing protein n=1 Tax=Chitinophaga flava TaxID=2259036 RepID=A0A365Y0E8_9BACT|nr:hypothetical protein [Chitinophaga flava]RBL91731.1 hypothetical protein DF182_03745 [Chitinophaga flava]